MNRRPRYEAAALRRAVVRDSYRRVADALLLDLRAYDREIWNLGTSSGAFFVPNLIRCDNLGPGFGRVAWFQYCFTEGRRYGNGIERVLSRPA